MFIKLQFWEVDVRNLLDRDYQTVNASGYIVVRIRGGILWSRTTIRVTLMAVSVVIWTGPSLLAVKPFLRNSLVRSRTVNKAEIKTNCMYLLAGHLLV